MTFKSSWILAGLAVLGSLATFTSACDDIDSYMANYASVDELDLTGVSDITCPEPEDREDLPEIVISSGKDLTIKSDASVKFINLRFTIEAGATLTFDMPMTQLGPNSRYTEGAGGFIVQTLGDGTVIFTGEVLATTIRNVRSVFNNEGLMEFKGKASFLENGNVFRSNYGTLKFRDDTVFKGNWWLAIDNQGEDAFVRFSKTVTFDDNADNFDGASGCGVSNRRGTVIFRGDASFLNHDCDEGAAVYNGGKMRFYGKAKFNDNRNLNYEGGGVHNVDGTLIFKKAVQFNRNLAETSGAGIAVSGGEVTFKKYVQFKGNGIEYTGAAFSVSDDAKLTFEKPNRVRWTGNYIIYNEYRGPITGCTLAYLEDGATVVGFDTDDPCMEDTSGP